ncbi:MAG: glycoside hydrolase family 42, partial [Phycisphaerae bacterium]|nr:glycoside hydrolase family 42 [Phycisphaerae bacterium]
MPASNRSLAVLISFCLVFGAATATSTARGVKGPPRLEQRGKAKQLVVDGDPFLVVGGELGNSTASDLEYLADALDRCASMNVNTVMLPVYWDLVEPVEGEFDFSLVEGAIDLARERDLKLVYLWFATWKNSMSAYAPTWVKRDTTRFPRIRQSNGEAAEIISPESISARDADARAFAQLMRWTKSYDAGRHTVVMAQVENEIGMIPDPRDHGAPSDAIFTHAVPDKLVRLAGNGDLGPEIERIWRENGGNRSGPWSRVFGDSPEGQEIFAAWRFASYVEHVAAAGKREYALPMFVNAALIRPGYRPGNYPSGGPLPHLIELWQATAPSLDMLSPDIYFPNFMDWASRYHRAGNPVFIPEMAPSMRASANAVFAVGALNAIGSGPFAIEDVRDDKAWLLRRCYRHLRNMSSLILDAQSDGRILGLAPEIGFDWTTSEDAAT